MSSSDLLEKVKKLRELTGVGFKDCKNAIDENKGDIEKSIEFLRKKGIAKASKKMERVAADGLVGICEKEKAFLMFEMLLFQLFLMFQFEMLISSPTCQT